MVFKNAISWFEIPTVDLHRAQIFYETIFDMEMVALDLPNIKMRMFPLQTMDGIGGSISYRPTFHYPSSTDGTLVYLNANPDLQLILDKTEDAGGKILVPKTQISPNLGFMAVILDTEGNRVGLHSIPM